MRPQPRGGWLRGRSSDECSRVYGRPVSIVRERLKIFVSRALRQRPLSRFSGSVAHLIGPPRLHDLYIRAALFTASPSDAAQALLGEHVDYSEEYADLQKRFSLAQADGDPHYPDYFMIEDSTAFLLYTLVRRTRPALTLEVGVADGRSTQVILAALDANNAGRLISVDINDDVGGAARGHARWSLRIHSSGRSSADELRRLLAEVGAPDLFFHDASHEYSDQYSHYLAAWERMRPGSVFLSDDIDWSCAFIDLTSLIAVKPIVLTDRRKATGMFIRP
jgi:predicted O-methyltransferase YrrM